MQSNSVSDSLKAHNIHCKSTNTIKEMYFVCLPQVLDRRRGGVEVCGSVKENDLVFGVKERWFSL